MQLCAHNTAVFDQQQKKRGKPEDWTQFKRVFEEDADFSLFTYTIPTILAGTAGLLRYLLRVNSTKITPLTWQSQSLPLNEENPWLATFVSPLYNENISNLCVSLENPKN